MKTAVIPTVAAMVLLLAGTIVAQDRGGQCPPCCGRCLPPPPATAPAEAITDAQRNTLLAMSREEKLAHDVYVTLGRKYDLMPFRNIPKSEQRHQAAMASLLERYEIPDPVQSLPEGKFDDPAVQALFDKFVAQGMESEIAALKVGAEIEELDIADLRRAVESCTQEDIKSVLAALERASENHLRAFVRNLSARNVKYEAAHLEQAELDRITTAVSGRGNAKR